MFMRSFVLALACAGASVPAVAATLELVVDVQTTARSKGQVSGASVDWQPDPAFQPEHFEITLSVDLQRAYRSVPVFDDTGGVSGLSAFNLQFSRSPYSLDLENLVPLDAGWDKGAIYWQTMSGHEPSSEIRPTTTEAYFHEGSWPFGPQQPSYVRWIDWVLPGAPMTLDDLKAPTTQAFVDFLRASIGSTYANAWGEIYLGSSGSLRMTGDVTILSASVVPEPDTLALAVCGLLAVALQARGRNA